MVEKNYTPHTYCMESAEGLSKVCKWAINANEKDWDACKHVVEGKQDFQKGIKDSILDCIGNTPLVRVNNI